MERSLARIVLFCLFAAGFSSSAMAESEQARASEPGGALAMAPAPVHPIRVILRNQANGGAGLPAAYFLAESGKEPRPASEAAAPIANRAPLVDLPFHDEVLAAAHTSGLEPALIHAMIRVESNYDARAASPKGAIGLMQLMPGTAKRYGVKNSRNPVQNISGGTRYLIDLQRLFDNDLKLALAAYNAGENAVLRYGRSIPKFPETREYVSRVLAEYERLRKLL